MISAARQAGSILWSVFIHFISQTPSRIFSLILTSPHALQKESMIRKRKSDSLLSACEATPLLDGCVFRFPDGSMVYRCSSDQTGCETLRSISSKLEVHEEELIRCNPRHYVTHSLPGGSLIELPQSFCLKRRKSERKDGQTRTKVNILSEGTCVRTKDGTPAIVEHRDCDGWYHLTRAHEAAGGVWVRHVQGPEGSQRVRSYDVLQEAPVRPQKWAEDMQGMLIEVKYYCT
jgi:hypothetical protein